MKMKFFQNILTIIIFGLICNVSLSNKTKNSYKINNKRKTDNSNFQPIRILIDVSRVYSIITTLPIDFSWAFGNCSILLSELISVERVTKANPIKLDFEKHPELAYLNETINETIIKGTSDYDAVIIPNLIFDQGSFNITTLSRDNNERPTLCFMNISYSQIAQLPLINLEYYLMHCILRFLCFSYENLDYFPTKAYYTSFDERMKLNTTYINTRKVLDVAKKYYNCQNITGIPLENQDNNNIPLWDARLLLEDIMSSYNYKYRADQVISEFTLALLEDSGWYKVNYYTGGLMRFGKNKGCEFIYNRCSEKFKNEFCENKENFNSKYTSCSSGRLSRTYCSYEGNNYLRNLDYFKAYQGKGSKEVDYCVINEPYYIDLNTEKNVGSCKYADSNEIYAKNFFYIDYQTIERKDLINGLNEKFSNNSFCVLSSLVSPLTPNNYKNTLLNSYIPLCYEMFCSESTLTIKIKEQYIACPRQGGKVNVKGEFKGYIYCPDYNLICTGTVLCNDMIDCILNHSLIKESTYKYDYDIETSQIPSELNKSRVLIGYEDSSDGKCRKNCSQCYLNKTCFECRENYALAGDYLGQDISEIKCLNININNPSGYYLVNNIYYPCLPNCDLCTNDSLCLKCKQDFYFIKNNYTYCDTGKNLSKYYTNDNGISYYPCDTHFNHCEICSAEKSCDVCDRDFYFIGELNTKCEKLDNKTNYFTENGGINYLLCSNYIPNSYSCISRIYSTKCYDGFYMLNNDRTKCINDTINIEEYYIEEGPMYFPCDTNFNHCLTCTDESHCTKCKNNYIFLRGETRECFIFEQNKLYIENNNYYPCYDAFPKCDECNEKGNCYKCSENYYLIFDANNNLKCEQINVSKYYRNENGVYILCSKDINNCEQCLNDKVCTKCKNNFYFLKNDNTTCRNNLNLDKYYSEDNGLSYFPCDESISNCDYCSNKTICEKCKDNFYFYKGNKGECIDLINLEKFYKKGDSYFPCNESITNCDKCSDEKTCYECYNNLKLILNYQNFCYNENFLKNNLSLVKKNESFYMECSESIEHCSSCYLSNEIKCSKCEANFVFLNENQTSCININDLIPLNEYIKINNTNYFTCSYKGVKNCLKCENLTMCNLCSNNYAFLNFDYTHCILKSEMQKGFYSDYNEIMYFSCLKNCDICVNGKECIQCKENFISFAQNTYCSICDLNVSYINTNLTQELITELAGEYVIEYELDFAKVNMYLNNDSDFSIIIFRASTCTKLIFEENNYIEINIDELLDNITKIITIPYIVVNVNYNHKNILQFFSIDDKNNINLINITELYPGYSEQNYLKIKNNFKLELSNQLSQVLLDEVFENDYNIFKQDESVFNDFCKNFKIENIDIPLNERRKLLYLGNNDKEILCNDINCEIKNIFLSNTTSFCECGIKTEFNYLFSPSELNNDEYNNYINQKKNINSFLLFKCAKESFNSNNIKSNIGFYISLVLFIIQLILLIVYIIYTKAKNKDKNKKPKKKKLKSNPPKLEKVMSFSVSEDLEEQNDNNNNINNNIISEKDNDKDDFDSEKKNQLKESENINLNINEKKKWGENILDDDSDEEGDDIQNVQEKDIDSLRAREIENEIVYLGGTITPENVKIQENKYKKSRGGEIFGKNLLNKEISKTKNNKNKLNFLEEESYQGDEIINTLENDNNKGKLRTTKLYRNKKNFLTQSKDSLASSEMKEIQYELYQKTENIKFNDAIKKKNIISFWEYYFKLIQLKQPLINLFSPIKCLKLEENNIPTLIKIMRIIFILCLNIFFNIFHLNQKYFRKKFEHFNNKYNITTIKLSKNISSNEIFSYAMTHEILSGFISFIICFVIKSIINFYVFNLRKKLNEINLKSQKKKNINDQEKIEEIFLIIKKERKCYILFFSICLVVMILIFYLLINFNEVYRGGILDLIAGFIWTFIFLQIIPFIYCLLFAFIRYLGVKKKNEKIYYFSQIIFF